MLTGFTCSTFDLMHPGHIMMLQLCRAQCDVLVVGLQTAIPDRPEKNTPVQTVFERFIQLEALGLADRIVPYESEADLMNILLTLPKPNVRFIGEEYQHKDYTGKELTSNTYYGDRTVIYTPREHDWSTSRLRVKIEQQGTKKT